jgi:4-diphosphocytidyl-2-C-methyl-D-erythritol kinase
MTSSRSHRPPTGRNPALRHLRVVSDPAVTVRAPGKVNLFLRIGPLGADGYHQLVTVYQAVAMFEEVTATQALPGAGISLTVEGPGSDQVPDDDTNLAWRAAALLARHRDRPADVALQIRKGVPVAGGMAGGSADAAAALVACDALWETGCTRAELFQLAAQLGSDVPFCIMGNTAIGTGRGHLLSPVMTSGEFNWAFAVVHKGLPTPEVYQTFDQLMDIADAFADGPGELLEPAPDPALLMALRAGDAEALGKALSNDLQAAALSLRPDLAQTIDIARVSGALGVLVSGSGPTVAALAKSDRHAKALASIWVAEGAADAVFTTYGPAPGARIV